VETEVRIAAIPSVISERKTGFSIAAAEGIT
jgi:hypothetical protein